MSISTPPPSAPPVKKKSGMGCFGCGCLILLLILLLVVGLVVGGGYFGYNKIVSLTSTTPAVVPSFNGPDQLYASVRQKIEGFDHDVKNHQAAKISLSADEINTLIARSPEIAAQNAHIFVTLTGNHARVQGALPTDQLTKGMLKDRFMNIDATFGLQFDASSKTLGLKMQAFQIGTEITPDKLLPTVEAELNPFLNLEIQQSPDFKALVNEAKTFDIRDGQLVIETQ